MRRLQPRTACSRIIRVVAAVSHRSRRVEQHEFPAERSRSTFALNPQPATAQPPPAPVLACQSIHGGKMSGYSINIEEKTLANDKFREVLYTTSKSQLV